MHHTIWRIADDLHGSVDGWDFKQYVHGMIFYRYIPENIRSYINAGEHASDDTSFDYALLSDEDAEQARADLVRTKGYFMLPSQLFSNLRQRAKADPNLNETLEGIFNVIENSAQGSPSEDDLKGLFDDVDVNSNKLGATVAQRNEKLVKLINSIAEIAKERIRRAGKKIIEENRNKEGIENLDIGFRVLKTDSSNMKDVYYAPAQTEQNLLDLLSDNIKEDRTPEDLLFQVMLDLGVSLSSKIERKIIENKEVFIVEDGFLIACFDKNIKDETVKAIANKKPYYAIFRDSSMANDSIATNFNQIFDSLSPQTVRRVI